MNNYSKPWAEHVQRSWGSWSLGKLRPKVGGWGQWRLCCKRRQRARPHETLWATLRSFAFILPEMESGERILISRLWWQNPVGVTEKLFRLCVWRMDMKNHKGLVRRRLFPQEMIEALIKMWQSKWREVTRFQRYFGLDLGIRRKEMSGCVLGFSLAGTKWIGCHS